LFLNKGGGMYASKKSPVLSRSKKSDFEQGDLAYGLNESRTAFFDLNGVILKRELGATIDSFAATGTEHELLSYGIEKYPERQGDFVETLLTHPKYSKIQSEVGFLYGNKVLDDPEWVSRKCKAGLYWAAKRNITVHFVLDDIDMDRVVFKKDKSYTASELRWLFRNKDNDNVKHVVKYWKDGGYVPAPWESDEGRELWENYKPKSHK